MKKYILVLAFATFSAGTVLAQSTVTPAPAAGATQSAERAERLTKRMTDQLTLSADQSAKIKAINLQRITEQQAIRQEMQAMQEKYKAQYKAVLTPEQYTKFEASQTPGRDRRGPNGLPRKRLNRVQD